MICNNCKHKLPDDSEFCQYCGSKIEVAEADSNNQSPMDFVINDTTTQAKSTPKKEKIVKTKYCRRCGSLIDNKTKVCTGCGKQYFRGFRFTKFSITVIALALVIATVSTLCVLQYVSTQELTYEINDLKKQVKNKQSTIDSLEDRVDSLQSQVRDNSELVDFVDRYVVFVEDNGTKYYHKYGCVFLWDNEPFWAFNIDAAKDNGYRRCPLCHD